MIYLIDAKIDYNLLAHKLAELLPRLGEQTTKMHDSGHLLGIRRKANAKAVIAIWNIGSDRTAAHSAPVPPRFGSRGISGTSVPP